MIKIAQAKYRIENPHANVTIGESDDFSPVMRISKWHDKAVVRVTPIGVEKSGSKEKQQRKNSKDLIEYSAIRKEGRTSRGELHRWTEGSTEWEVVWYSKNDFPTQDFIEFDFETTQGLQFFHQGIPTQEEVAAGLIRPDNVINSFAVYGSITGRVVNSDGTEVENYETGKLFHLYRSKLIAGDGSEKWCLQEMIGTRLRIWIDKQWMDSQQLPITLDPSFGYTSIGSSTIVMGKNYLHVIGRAAPAATGTLSSVSFFLYADVVDDDITLGVYNDTAGTPTTKLVDSAGGEGTEFAWTTQNMDSNPTVSAGQYYWFGVNRNIDYNMRVDSGGTGWTYQAQTYSSGNLPASWTGGTPPGSYWASIYGTYVEAPAGGPFPHYVRGYQNLGVGRC